MTFQPPPNQGNQPPQPGQPGQPQQPGQFGPPPGGGYPAGRPGGNKPAFDPKTVNPLDWGVMGVGVLALIFSLFDYYTVSVSFSGVSESASANAWHGFFGWFAAITALAGAAAVAVDIFAPHVQTPLPRRLLGLILFAVSTLCVILALFVIPDGGAGDVPGVDTGHGFGYWASLVLIIAGLVMSLMRFQQTGGELPGGMGSKVPNIGGHGPQGGSHGGGQGGGQGGPGYAPPNQPPPSPGYGPPNQPPPPPPGYGPPPQQ